MENQRFIQISGSYSRNGNRISVRAIHMIIKQGKEKSSGFIKMTIMQDDAAGIRFSYYSMLQWGKISFGDY